MIRLPEYDAREIDDAVSLQPSGQVSTGSVAKLQQVVDDLQELLAQEIEREASAVRALR